MTMKRFQMDKFARMWASIALVACLTMATACFKAETESHRGTGGAHASDVQLKDFSKLDEKGCTKAKGRWQDETCLPPAKLLTKKSDCQQFAAYWHTSERQCLADCSEVGLNNDQNNGTCEESGDGYGELCDAYNDAGDCLTGDPGDCAPPQILIGTTCQCPTGTSLIAGQCQADAPTVGDACQEPLTMNSANQCVCPAGQEKVLDNNGDTLCVVANACPEGQIMNEGVCQCKPLEGGLAAIEAIDSRGGLVCHQPLSCPANASANYELSVPSCLCQEQGGVKYTMSDDNQCVVDECPNGYLDGGKCVACGETEIPWPVDRPNACQEKVLCEGENITWNAATNSCTCRSGFLAHEARTGVFECFAKDDSCVLGDPNQEPPLFDSGSNSFSCACKANTQRRTDSTTDHQCYQVSACQNSPSTAFDPSALELVTSSGSTKILACTCNEGWTRTNTGGVYTCENPQATCEADPAYYYAAGSCRSKATECLKASDNYWDASTNSCHKAKFDVYFYLAKYNIRNFYTGDHTDKVVYRYESTSDDDNNRYKFFEETKIESGFIKYGNRSGNESWTAPGTKANSNNYSLAPGENWKLICQVFETDTGEFAAGPDIYLINGTINLTAPDSRTATAERSATCRGSWENATGEINLYFNMIRSSAGTVAIP